MMLDTLHPKVRRLLGLTLAGFIVLGAAACDNGDGPAEEAEDAAEEAGDAIEGTAEEAVDAVEGAADEAEEAVEGN